MARHVGQGAALARTPGLAPVLGDGLGNGLDGDGCNAEVIALEIGSGKLFESDEKLPLTHILHMAASGNSILQYAAAEAIAATPNPRMLRWILGKLGVSPDANRRRVARATLEKLPTPQLESVLSAFSCSPKPAEQKLACDWLVHLLLEDTWYPTAVAFMARALTSAKASYKSPGRQLVRQVLGELTAPGILGLIGIEFDIRLPAGVRQVLETGSFTDQLAAMRTLLEKGRIHELAVALGQQASPENRGRLMDGLIRI